MATTASISSCDGPLGLGLRRFPDEYSSLYLRFLRMSWSLSSVDGPRAPWSYEFGEYSQETDEKGDQILHWGRG